MEKIPLRKNTQQLEIIEAKPSLLKKRFSITKEDKNLITNVRHNSTFQDFIKDE